MNSHAEAQEPKSCVSANSTILPSQDSFINTFSAYLVKVAVRVLLYWLGIIEILPHHFIFYLAEVVGFEPTTIGVKVQCLYHLAIPLQFILFDKSFRWVAFYHRKEVSNNTIRRSQRESHPQLSSGVVLPPTDK